jgi:hypothetical protein
VLTIIDRTLAGLLTLGAIGHSIGSFKAYSQQPVVLLWALCASLLIVLLGALNLLRSTRPGDVPLAMLTGAGTAAWLISAIIFGMIIHNMLDPRVVLFVLLCLGLIAFNIRSALSRR